MKTLFKFVAVVAVLGILVVVGGTLALRRFWPPEKIKAFATEQLSSRLKREVSIGSVSLGLWSGLELSDLKISEAPTFAKGTFVSSARLGVKVAWMPLLKREIVVRQILLQRPEIQVIRLADGKTFNFSDLLSNAPAVALASSPRIVSGDPVASMSQPLGPGLRTAGVTATDGSRFNWVATAYAAEPASAATPAAPPFSQFLIANAVIQDGLIHFVDQSPAKQTLDIRSVSVKLKNVSLDKPFNALASLHVQMKGMDLAFSLDSVVDAALGALHIKQAGVDFKKVQVRMSGDLSKLKSAEPLANVNVNVPSCPIEDLLSLAPSSVPADVSLKGTMTAQADLSGTPSRAKFSAKLNGASLAIVQGTSFAKPAGTPLDVTFNGTVIKGTGLKVVFDAIRTVIGANTIAGAGTYEQIGIKDALNFSAVADRWSVAEVAPLSPMAAPYHPTGSLAFEAKATGSTKAPLITLKTNGDVSIANAKQEYYEGRDLHMAWSLTDVTADLSRISGTASMKQGPGKILNAEKLAASSRIGRIALSPLVTLQKLLKNSALQQANLPSFQTIAFDSIVGDYVLKSGVMEVKTFELSGRDLSVSNRGIVGLSGEQILAMSVQLKLPPASIGGTLGQTIPTDEQGRQIVKFSATNTVPNPKIKLDINEMQKKALQRAGQELLKNPDIQNAVDDLQKSLKGIFR